MSKLHLAMETSAKWTSVAIADGASVIAAIHVETKNRHNEMLPKLIEEVMTEAAAYFRVLEFIGISIGPGSFTSLRIGLLYAKGIAFAHRLQIVPVSTLDVLNASLDIKDGVRLPLMDAYKGEVFTARYEESKRTTEPTIVKPSQLHEIENSGNVYVFGPALTRYREFIKRSLGKRAIFPVADVFPSPTVLSGLAWERREKAQDPGLLEPFYLRKPDAKLPQKRNVSDTKDAPG